METEPRSAYGEAPRGRRFPRPVKAVEHALTRVHNFLFRSTGGRWGRTFMKAPVLLLTTVGRKSGKKRTSPLLYLEQGEDLILVASHAGDIHDPAWCHNLRAQPLAEVEIAGAKRTMRAEFLDEAERERVWPDLVRLYAPYQSYQNATSRKIPVIRLRPVASQASG